MSGSTYVDKNNEGIKETNNHNYTKATQSFGEALQSIHAQLVNNLQRPGPPTALSALITNQQKAIKQGGSHHQVEMVLQDLHLLQAVDYAGTITPSVRLLIPTEIKVIYNLGMSYFKEQKLGEALQIFDDLLGWFKLIKPPNTIGIWDETREIYIHVLNLKGLILMLKGKSLEALIYLETEKTKEDETNLTLNTKAKILASLDRTNEALMSISRAIELHNVSFDIHNTKGIILAKLRQYKESIEEFQLAFSLATANSADPKDAADILVNLAYVQMLSNSDVDAYGSIMKLQMLYHGDPERVLITDNFEDWIDYVTKKLFMSSRALYVMGSIFDRLGDENRADYCFDKSKDLHSSSKFTFYHEGNRLLKQSPDKSLKMYDYAIAADPFFAEAYNAKAVALSFNKRYNEAKVEVRQAIAIKPSLSIAHENLLKLTISEQKQPENFLDFWNSSLRKRIFALSLGFAAVAILVIGISDPFGMASDTSNVTSESQNATKKTTILGENGSKTSIEQSTSNITKNGGESSPEEQFDIPQSHLIIVGFILLILLSPQLKTAKVGPLEVELKQSDMTTVVDTTLSLTEEGFVHEEDYYTVR